MAEIFISYSRRDKEFVRRLGEALAAQERVAWVDWKDIPLTAEWQQEILTNIEAADSFVFVISPDSAASFNCRKEIDHAAANNKRMLPILYRSVPDNDVPETLARFQRIDLSEESLFDAGFAGLVKALDTDLPWVQMHTRLLTRAKEWERQARDTSFLLRGKDLRDAEQWIARRAEHEPKPTPLQVQYLQLSRRAATRQRRIIVGTAAVTFLIAAGLAVYAFVTQGRKEDALARSLAGRSASILSNSEDTELAALLALESVKRRPTEEGAQALRNALVYLRRTHALFGGGQGVSEIAFSPDSKRLVTIGRNDAAARVFDVDTGKERLRLQHDASVTKAVFSPDGRFVITGSEDKTARIWDAAGGRELHRLVCDSEVFAVTMSKDGLAGTGSGTAAQVWDSRDRSRVGKAGVSAAGESGGIQPERQMVRQRSIRWIRAALGPRRRKQEGSRKRADTYPGIWFQPCRRDASVDCRGGGRCVRRPVDCGHHHRESSCAGYIPQLVPAPHCVLHRRPEQDPGVWRRQGIGMGRSSEALG